MFLLNSLIDLNCSYLFLIVLFHFGSIWAVGSRFGRMAGCSDLAHKPLECGLGAVACVATGQPRGFLRRMLSRIRPPKCVVPGVAMSGSM